MNNFDQNNKNEELIAQKINKITLSLATDEDILEWSHGEVTKPETINYKSYKPEKDGLFDELIFGPTTDYKCPVCSTKYKKSDENTICTKTPACEKYQPVILPKITRRSRMGHIKLHNPVVHFWFFKIDHSIISKLLGLRVNDSSKQVTKGDLEKLIYYKSHIVLESGNLKSLKKNTIIDINEAATIYEAALVEMQGLYETDTDEYEDITFALEELREYAQSKIGKDFGIDFYQYNEIIHEYSDAKIDTGSRAIEYLLNNINLEEEAQLIQDEISIINAQAERDGLTTSKEQDRSKLYKRLTVINSFIKSGQDPKSMLIYNLPVIPADLRPLVQLDGGRHSTSDVNELYRRIIIRNNRLAKWNESDAPMLIKQNEYRMIQEAVDALIDNARKKPTPVTSKDSHPLKSISDALTGKKGRFRQNLLGKRVDYSGRSVIVVGPSLRMHEVGIPRDMAAKLFEPWIIKELIKSEPSITSVKSAKKMIESLNPIIWPYVEKAIEGRPVLLNRAPTLHRLSIQAFQPVLIRGKAIKLHPLVTTAFNADFDGDQMAVHVPISDQAVREAKELMLASKNILGPKDGEPIINPSQDMILGLYYLTIEKANQKGEGNYYASYDEMMEAYENGHITLHTRIVLPVAALEKESVSKFTKAPYLVSTVGKFILNKAFPSDFEFIFGKSVNVKETMLDDGTVKTTTTEKIDTSADDLSKYTLEYGTNFIEAIAKMPVNIAVTKKDIAKIVRKVYEKYVAVVTKEDVAEVVGETNRDNYLDRFEDCAQLIDYKGETISPSHAKILANLIKDECEAIEFVFGKKYKHIKPASAIENGEDITTIASQENPWTIKEYTKILETVWFNYTNLVASILDRIKNLGFKFSTISGTTISMNDITTLNTTAEKIKVGEEYTDQLKKYFEEGYLTDDERYSLTISKWSEVKDSIEKDLKEVTKSDLDNPLFMMFTSGARGNSSNFTQLAGMRGLMNNNTKILKADAENDRVVRSTVEIPVKSSFLSGLTAYEFYSSTHGARKGLTDTALNTAKSGYLTRRLVDVAQGIVVRQDDCGSDFGFVVKDIKDTKTDTVIESLVERIEGRFTNTPILDDNGNVLVEGNTLITPELADKIVNEYGKDQVEIRSVLSCHTRNGVCKHCYGKDLATNRIVNIGEAVGVVAAQSIGEPGTQLTMRTFHTGGVAGVEDITGGFGRLIELIDAYDAPWGKPAVISKVNGIIKSIKPAKDKNGKDTDIEIVEIETRNPDGSVETVFENGKVTQKKRVKVGDRVVAGQKIYEGPIVLNDLLKYADPRAVQNYLLKEIQRLYRLQGITISDKYIEIIIRQMLSKIMITDSGDSRFFTGSLVDTFVFQKENGKLLAQGKRPAYGEVKIRGAKQTPLLSDSFLAAASYQETAKILVNASIAERVDHLEGLKENIILGHKIPAGTNSNYELKGKYDIRDPRSYFTSKFPVISNAEGELNGMEVTSEPFNPEFIDEVDFVDVFDEISGGADMDANEEMFVDDMFGDEADFE
ncbi:DNA-directed RNA polymerase subunit beta' [Mycoplasma sp. Pen4]|uniref:DNA-directed RNA polymerase subunit beta' n=1 Tax=Mycoplasma sp. Pen4 TaxID=640330 RepID=UPI00165403BF|nr:DNA-directed RNA polymerase subunit beta' [Mycoplasma sp. Pen4]QNM93598.1 DNA-directed RNA polymerase subunit beta' [Mycoplasma sp. Pen4]